MIKNPALSLDLYELTMADAYWHYKKKTRATFDLFVRSLPHNRSFLLSAGLEDIISYIRSLKFTVEDLAYFKSLKIFSREFLSYLKNFRFTGDISAIDEGEVFFANEPVIRVTAPIIEAQILESYLLNTINLQTMIASKAARVFLAAQGRGVYDFSLRRTHGWEAGLKVARCAYLAGFRGTSNVLAGRSYNLPVAGTMAHSFIMSFKSEEESFRAYAGMFPDRSIFLVDTYDTENGIKNAIKVGLELKSKGYKLSGIRLDSGELVGLSRMARRMLDKAGLGFVKIFASGNLDEFKIRDILKNKGSVDNFGVGTNMGSSVDAPFLDVIYKISEVTDESGRFLPTMKLSRGKATQPGRKQVFRVQDKKGNFARDVLALENEKIKGRPLLQKVVLRGKIIYHKRPLDRIREYALANLGRLPQDLRDVQSKYVYPVLVSPGLSKMAADLKLSLSKREGYAN